METACQAAMRGELDALQAALKVAEEQPGYTINAKGTSARTPLYQACLGRRPEIVEYLLKAGAVRPPPPFHHCAPAMRPRSSVH
jgi:ankyrin repeat protein